MLATGGLDRLRPARCAVRLISGFWVERPSSSASWTSVSFRRKPPNCTICLLATTCNDNALAPLRCLNSLERLTLYELCHVRRGLRFLLGCASIRELRLRSLGVWCEGGDEDLKPLVSIWPQLYAAKFECAKSFNRFNVFFGMPSAPMMKRLCLTGHSTDREEAVDQEALFAMQKACAALDIVYIHVYCPVDGRGTHIPLEASVSGGRQCTGV
ncbi:hypothetical protein MTO96_033190 [Rhipicephalus appendiculatus]